MLSFFTTLFQFIAHLDLHLAQLSAQYGTGLYAILFAIIFIETGFIIMPFLPGDSLLFAVGSLAAKGYLNIYYIMILLFMAAVLGDNLNYGIGRYLGVKLTRSPQKRWINPEYLQKAHLFYEKQGAKAILIGRFMPIIRTFIPFTAGMAKMTYRRFVCIDTLGVVFWVGGLGMAGYFFGNIPLVKTHFSLIIIGIIIISLLPVMYDLMMYRRGEKPI